MRNQIIGSSQSLLVSWAVICGFGVTSANAEILLLSNRYGDPTTVFLEVPEARTIEDQREWLQPIEITGAKIADEFAALCLVSHFNKTKYAAAIINSPYEYEARMVKLPPTGKRAAFQLIQHKSDSSLTTMWLGEDGDNLKGRFYASRTRGAMVTGGLDPKDMYAPQCSFSIRTSGLHSAQELSEALTKYAGMPAAKLVLKESFADGYWLQNEADGRTLRIAFSATDLAKDKQLFHISTQLIPTVQK